jgi:hypothetical protein
MLVNDYVSLVVPSYSSDSWTFYELNSFYIVDGVRYIIDDGMMRFDYLIEEWLKEEHTNTDEMFISVKKESYIYGAKNMSY